MVRRLKKRKNGFLNKFILISLFLISFNGCGYATRGYLYKENKIFVLPVVNKMNITTEGRRYSNYRTYPVLLERKLTNKIIDKFNVDGHLEVVTRSKDALTLNSVIKDYRKETTRYTDDNTVKEQRLWLDVEVRLVDPEEKVLRETTVSGMTSFYLIGEHAKTEGEAQEDLVADAARRIVEVVIDNW